MTGLDPYVGHVLDDKYRLERLLGRGGMGAVYLATHLGTERYVALKLITPQLMRNDEFVERFKREARAAGRLRHPNVVDVTDFGFAHAGAEPVAYLVMEYLDGCTLGDVLAEEQRLPLEWVVDILEQVCSAVHEAHQQGIVHRDLKPDNIWLEPNRLGGYRVKVLDFGIAKLAELDAPIDFSTGQVPSLMSTLQDSVNTSSERAEDHAGGPPAKADLESETLLFTADKENSASLEHEKLEASRAQVPTTVVPQSDETKSTHVRSAGITQAYSTAAPTIAPFEPDDAPSDAPGDAPSNAPTLNLPRQPNTAQPAHGSAPVDGDRTLRLDQATRRLDVGSHTTLPAGSSQGSELTRVGAIMGTPIYMSPEQCAAKTLDARSDIYSLGVIAYQMLAGEPPFSGDLPTVMRDHKETAPPHLRERVKKVPKRAAGVVMAALAKDPAERPQTAVAFANSLRAEAEGIGSLYRRAFALYSEYFPKFLRLSLIAHIPVIVATILLVGLEIAEHYLPEAGTVTKVLMIGSVILVGLLQIAAYFLAAAAISGMTAVIVTQLSVAPLRPVELRTAFAVLKKRWRAFLRTSIRITIRQIIGFILFVIPGIVISVRYMLYAPVVLMEGLEKKAALRRARELASRSWRTVSIIVLLQFLLPITVSGLLGRLTVGTGGRETGVHFTTSSLTHQIYQQVSGLINIFIIPLASIVSALLYLKMRQLGGETLIAALDQVEDVDVERSEWQRRMRTRLSVNTPRGSVNTPRSR